MSKIILDLRGLNYPFLTGINTVTLRILHEMCQSQDLLQNHQFYWYGLRSERITELIQDFTFLTKIIHSSNQNKIELLQNFRWQQIQNLIQFYLKQTNFNFKDYNLVYQTQPKPLALHPKNKFITTFHDLSAIKNFNQPVFKQKLQENKLSYLYITQRADKIIVPSYSTGYDLIKTLKVPESKIKVVYQALPELDKIRETVLPTLDNREALIFVGDFKNRFDLNPTQKPYFLALSAFEYRKNYHNLLLAWQILSKTEPDIYKNHSLIIAGNVVDQNYLDYLDGLIQKFQFQNVYILTNISNPEKEYLLQNCLALVYTSLYEGFGFPILEAQKERKAVLTSNISAMPEIGGEAVLCVNPTDSGQIADGLAILVKDTKFRESLEIKTTQNLSRFNWFEYELALKNILTCQY